MLLRRIAVQNVRSFLDRQELRLDGVISIIVGPNGGGKTNLLDAIVVMLRKHLLTSVQVQETLDEKQQKIWQLSPHPGVNNMLLERHWLGANEDQIIEVEVEVSSHDIENMESMKVEYEELSRKSWRLVGYNEADFSNWNLENLHSGMRLTYTLVNGIIRQKDDIGWVEFLDYLRYFEAYSWLRQQEGLDAIRFPLLYLPTTRAANFTSNVQLSGFNQWESKVNTDANYSRTGSSVSALAIGNIAKRYRILLEKDDGLAGKTMDETPAFKEMSKILESFGYKWFLGLNNPLANSYDLLLEKSGSKFNLAAGSSGEREFMTYILAVYALDIRNALILVDEPELHLHPRWQRALLALFEKLSASTGNQFVLATHSPNFISPSSIQYVSRVHSSERGSCVTPINISDLPNARQLMNLVNSVNNEKIFFADKVILVEGVSDRIFFEAVIAKMRGNDTVGKILEVVSVSGKSYFDPYLSLMRSASIEWAIVGDLDYLEQIGSDEIKKIFGVNYNSIKRDVIDNSRSIDGKALVSAIDKAIESGKWENASEIWEYIKSRRLKISDDISKVDREKIEKFIDDKKSEGIFILKRGALENYLPSEFSFKHLDKLVNFVSSTGFWEDIKDYGRDEIEAIVNSIMVF